MTLGFTLDNESHAKSSSTVATTSKKHFMWRDKSIEVIIRVLHKFLNQKPMEEYFKQFDRDHDNHLTPSEFR